MKNFIKKHKTMFIILLVSFTLPLVLTCIAFAVEGVVPFGDNSVLIWDAKIQYKDYFGYLWDVLHGNASLDYSTAKSLGGNMFGLFAYYLTCPLNLLLFFFKKSQISLFFSLSTILKISFAGLTCSYFIKKRFNINSVATVLLSLSYALMEYNVYYCRNIMWLDGVVILPLICIGVYDLLYKNKKGLLFSSVALAIISNWYSGYMACLMGGFYFLFELFLKYDWRNFKNNFVKIISDCFRVGVDMILGVLTGGIILLPACLSLVGGKATFQLIHTTMNFSFLSTFKGFAINAAVNKPDAPILFCGGLALLLVVYFIFNKNFDKKIRLASSAFLIFMLLGFSYKEFELMWTAFVQSHSYDFRFSFVFAFAMILVASFAVKSIQENKYKIDKNAMFTSLGIIVGVALLLDLNNMFTGRFLANVYLMIFAAYAVLLLIIFDGKDTKSKKNCVVKCVSVLTISGLLCGELLYNAVLAFRDYNVSEKEYVSYIDEMDPIIKEIKEKDDTFYRIEKNYSYFTPQKNNAATSESLMFGYNSMENYSSTYDPAVDEFFASMGYSDSTYIPAEDSKENILFPTDSYWNSPMILIDSILGVKYEFSKVNTFGLENYSIDANMPKDYEIYKNPYALPMAFNVSNDLLEKPNYDLNPFENQKKFISSMLGYDSNIYLNPIENYISYEDKTETYELTAVADGPMYVYIDGTKFHSNDYIKNCELYVNGEYVQNTCQRFLINAEYIGEYKKGDVVEVQIKHVSKTKDEHKLYSAQLNVEEFENVYNILSNGYDTNLNINKDTISGTYTSDKDSMVMLSIPYDEGWDLYVDGNKTDIEKLAGTFIGFNLTKGTHEIEMKYNVPYLNLGIASTVVGLIGFASWNLIEKYNKKRKQK